MRIRSSACIHTIGSSLIRSDSTSSDGEPQGEQKLYLQTVDTLLDEIDNEQLWEVLKETDKLTLKMLVMRMQGFSGKEISCATGVPELAINNRIARLRKKIKKFF